MAKFFLNGKWKKRSVAALSMALSLTFALGVFTACGTPADDDDDDDDTSTTEVDTQLLKNGNFEFYSGKDTELADKRTFIHSPASWSFSSGSPASTTVSGIINTNQEEWDYYTKKSDPDFSLIDFDPDKTDSDLKTQANAKSAVKYAMDNWDKANAYDRLEFLYKYDNYFTGYKINSYDSSTEEGKFFADYKYSIDFEDVEKLREELGDTVELHETAEDEENDGSNLLMIHNSVDQYGVLGTAQSYSSSTTITLQAGTAAAVSVWVKTSNLKHYYSGDDAIDVTKDAGAYIGVTNTVGGSSLDQMQIKNIISDDWQQYTVYVRANTFATTTFKIALGLGMGDSNNRFEEVDGYALFDDLTCEIISDEEYGKLTGGLTNTTCELNSEGKDKIFDVSSPIYKNEDTFALDLHAPFTKLSLTGTVEIGLTKETSGTQEYESRLPDIRDGNTGSIVDILNIADIQNSSNKYLENIAENDFKNFPSQFDQGEIIMLLSTNGAAYTATVENDTAFTLEKDHYMLVSFFVKTSKIRSGKTGATAVLVDGVNETTISAFDSTTISTVDIDDEHTDIYDGWVQCFFFVKNETKESHTFSLKLCYGPTSVASAAETSYDDGYAAFANFQTMELSKTQYGYASSNSRAQMVSLTGRINYNSKFDDNSASTPFTSGELGTPVNFSGKQSGTIEVFGTNESRTPDELNASGLYTGLLNSDPDYVAQYKKDSANGGAAWNDFLNDLAGKSQVPNIDISTESGWWEAIFGDPNKNGYVANQPLVIMNTSSAEIPAYGYFAKTSSVSANSDQQVSMRVMVGGGAKAYIYLIDTSDPKAGFANTLSPVMPNVTYWYDDEGNILKEDPTGKKKSEIVIAYYLNENNGLYTKAGDTSGAYYANLANYKKDEDGNLLTTDDKVAFYYKEADGEYYAYYNKDTKEYSTKVTALSTDTDLETRYTVGNVKEQGTCIVVPDTNGSWVDVSFFVRAGNKAKDFRLEIWAGDRTCEVDKDYKVTGTGKGIPAKGYVFFDEYSTSSAGDTDTFLQGYIKEIAINLNKQNNAKPGDDDYLDWTDSELKLPVSNGEDSEYSAYYYTFTLYDSPDYLRYDKTLDEDWLGYDYTQSEQEERLIWFSYQNDGSLIGSPLYVQFVDYSANDVTVPDEKLKDDSSSGGDSGNTKDNTANILTIVSSVLFAAAILFAIGAVVVRKVLKNKPKKTKAKQPKATQEPKAPKLKVVKSDEAEAPEESAPSEPDDENNPYNE